ncbi:MAG: hypothetical protein FWE33_05670 [Defluviitaleaceae bacterium]|nr:hypothetical protein [Defluviitaleaceae bacterium]
MSNGTPVPPPTGMPPAGGKGPGEQKALIALILGIASLVCTPICGIISLVIGKQAEQEGYVGSNVKIGKILSFVSFGLWALGIVFYIIFVVVLSTVAFW